MSDVTKADIIAFRNRLLTQVSAKTANHDLRAVKTLFKSAREYDVIAEDPAASVKSAQHKTTSAKKRSFTLEELRVVLDVADPEWKSIILFGLYTGQRLADIATLRWSNVDVVKGEIRLTTRKTDKVMILPIATPLRRYLEALPSSDDVNTPLHRRAFEAVARQGKSGGLSRQFIDLLGQAGIREKQAHRSRGIGRAARRQAGAVSLHICGFRKVCALVAATFLCLGIVLSASNAVAQQKTLKELIVGTWALDSVYDQYQDGKKTNPWGPGVKGIAMYDANGWFTGQMMSANRSKTASNNPRDPVGQAIAHFGTYTVDETAKDHEHPH
jgi:hypothetical protein